MGNQDNLEIEAKFLEIDKQDLIDKLKFLEAEDLGENLLKEMIFYEATGEWAKTGRTFVRIRQAKGEVTLAYKNNNNSSLSGTEEIELRVHSAKLARVFLEKLGLVLSREQEKKRHSFKLNETMVDIDTWPGVPTYVELEGLTEGAVKSAAKELGLDWSKAVFGSARRVIEEHYRIPIGRLRHYTFDLIE